jgi:tRNA G46 methylase TrmB
MSSQPSRISSTLEQSEAKWDAFSDVYDLTAGYTSYCSHLTFFGLLDLHNRQNILEISCGGGSLTCEVATKKPKSAHLTS